MKLVTMRFCLALLLVLGITTASLALEPPTAEQIEQYKKDGTWEERQKVALAIGNHKMAPELVERTNYKLRRFSLQAQGKSDEEIAQLLPAPPSARQGMPTIGNVKMFVLLIEFNDYPHIQVDTQPVVHSQIFGPEKLNTYYNRSSYRLLNFGGGGGTGSPTAYPYESLNAYYNRSSYGLLNLANGSTLGWYNAGNRSDVAETDTGRETLIKNAISNFDTAGHDFSQYDNDGDGEIDYFAVIWTGTHGSWASFWWAYQTRFSDSSYSVDDKTLGKYSWQWESDSYPNGNFNPHTLIHETGHALGLPDYYDYDGTVGPDGGVGGLDMMDSNWGDHNAFSKFVLDWLTPTVISAQGSYIGQTLSSSASTADALLIMPNASVSPFGEFFIAQHRKREKNDADILTDGLLIWHVDARLNSSGSNYLYDNSYTDHKLLRLMEADGLEEIDQNRSANAGDFYTTGKSLTNSTSPNSKKYIGHSSGVELSVSSQTSDVTTYNAMIRDVPTVTISSPAHREFVSGTVLVTAAVTSASSMAHVEFFINGSSIGIDSTAPYTVNWNTSALLPGGYTVRAVATNTDGMQSFQEITGYIATGDVTALVADIASDNASGTGIAAALAKNNIKAIFKSSLDTTIDPSAYPLVFVCLGYYPEAHVLTEAESATLTAYLNSGGRLYMEGADTWNYDPARPVHAYFGIGHGSADGSGDLATVNGSGLTAGISFASSGVKVYIDRLEPVNGGIAIWQNSSPSYLAGISNQTAIYRTIGCSFEFGNIPTETLQSQVMTAYLSFFGISDSSHTLSVTKSGTGSGTVTSSPVGISCGNSCGAPFSAGQSVTLTATAASGSSFSSWSGACSGTAATCAVTMDANKSVTASFAQNTYTVTPSAGAGGTISPNTPQTVAHGSTKSFTVTPNAGYSVSSVTGCGGTRSGSTYTTGPVTADCAVTASFAQNTYTVTPSAGAGGTISPNTPQTVAHGSTKSFTVTPNAGYRVSSVTGCGGTRSGSTYTTGPVTADCSVTASFAQNTYTLSIIKSGSGTVTSSPAGISCGKLCDAPFSAGQSVTLTAAAANGSVFSDWSGACSGTTATCAVTMDVAKSVGANFFTKPDGYLPAVNLLLKR